jgi:hypothetical protein
MKKARLMVDPISKGVVIEIEAPKARKGGGRKSEFKPHDKVGYFSSGNLEECTGFLLDEIAPYEWEVFPDWVSSTESMRERWEFDIQDEPSYRAVALHCPKGWLGQFDEPEGNSDDTRWFETKEQATEWLLQKINDFLGGKYDAAKEAEHLAEEAEDPEW